MSLLMRNLFHEDIGPFFSSRGHEEYSFLEDLMRF